MFEEIYQAAFNDELEKIAKEEGIKPGYFGSIVPSLRAYYGDKPLKNIGGVVKDQLKGGAKGLGIGVAGGAAAGSVGALIAKALKKSGKVGKATAIGAGAGAYLGGLTGMAFGGAKGYQKIMKPKGITVRYPFAGLGISHEFTPSAAKKYKVKA